jgi:hypothetical protein
VPNERAGHLRRALTNRAAWLGPALVPVAAALWLCCQPGTALAADDHGSTPAFGSGQPPVVAVWPEAVDIDRLGVTGLAETNPLARLDDLTRLSSQASELPARLRAITGPQRWRPAISGWPVALPAVISITHSSASQPRPASYGRPAAAMHWTHPARHDGHGRAARVHRAAARPSHGGGSAANATARPGHADASSLRPGRRLPTRHRARAPGRPCAHRPCAYRRGAHRRGAHGSCAHGSCAQRSCVHRPNPQRGPVRSGFSGRRLRPASAVWTARIPHVQPGEGYHAGDLGIDCHTCHRRPGAFPALNASTARRRPNRAPATTFPPSGADSAHSGLQTTDASSASSVAPEQSPDHAPLPWSPRPRTRRAGTRTGYRLQVPSGTAPLTSNTPPQPPHTPERTRLCPGRIAPAGIYISGPPNNCTAVPDP